MLKSLRAGVLAFAALCLAPFAAQAACPTAPSYTTLSGLDAASATKSMQMLDTGSGLLSSPLLRGWNGTAAVALTADANCNLQVSIPGSVAVTGAFWQATQPTSMATLPDTTPGDLAAIRSAVANIVAPFAGTAVVTVTRPADTTLYTINDVLADSTSAPTSGGFTFSNVCSASGKTSLLTTLVVVSSNDPATTLQGELWLFNASVTAVNDNAAFALSDADSLKLVTKIPFALETSTGGSGTNSIFVATGLDTRVTCSGSANLRALFKVKNGYTPASGEQLQASLSFKGDN